MDEIDRVWVDIEKLKIDLAVNKERIDQNTKNIDSLIKQRVEVWERQFRERIEKDNRANNVKIAVIGVLAVVLPTLIGLAIQGM